VILRLTNFVIPYVTLVKGADGFSQTSCITGLS